MIDYEEEILAAATKVNEDEDLGLDDATLADIASQYGDVVCRLHEKGCKLGSVDIVMVPQENEDMPLSMRLVRK